MAGRVIEDPRAMFNAAALGVTSTIIDPGDVGFGDRAGTHCAGFQRDMEIGAIEARLTLGLASGTQRQNLGMRRRVVVFTYPVSSGGNHHTLTHENRADRGFPSGHRGSGLL